MNKMQNPDPCRSGQPPEDHVHAWMHVAVIGNRCPEKAQPDQQKAGKFFRPEEGIIQDVTAENLEDDNSGHRYAKQEQKALGVVITGFAEPFQRPYNLADTLKNCHLIQSLRCAQKFYCRHITHMAMVKFLRAP